MKKKLFPNLIFAIFLSTTQLGFPQGFIDLNFENPILPLSPSGGMVSTANAVPGWTAYNGQGIQTGIFYNGMSLGGPMVSLNDTNAGGSSLDPRPIQGKYSVFLLGSPVSIPISAGIGQTGTIPLGIQSISFWGGYSGFQVAFNGQPINYFVTSSTANYNVYAADISAYAGQTGELLFTAPARNALLLDNIQFSLSPIPEPSTLAVGSLGALLLVYRRWRNSSQ